jgi:hypothetical protein
MGSLDYHSNAHRESKFRPSRTAPTIFTSNRPINRLTGRRAIGRPTYASARDANARRLPALRRGPSPSPASAPHPASMRPESSPLPGIAGCALRYDCRPLAGVAADGSVESGYAG